MAKLWTFPKPQMPVNMGTWIASKGHTLEEVIADVSGHMGGYCTVKITEDLSQAEMDQLDADYVAEVLNKTTWEEA